MSKYWRAHKRTVLARVVHSTLLYGTLVRDDALNARRNCTTMEEAQSKILIGLAAAFKTISDAAFQLITDCPPRQLREKTNMEITLKRGNEPKKLESDLLKWLSCKHRRLDYYLNQIQTGHEIFATSQK